MNEHNPFWRLVNSPQRVAVFKLPHNSIILLQLSCKVGQYYFTPLADEDLKELVCLRLLLLQVPC